MALFLKQKKTDKQANMLLNQEIKSFTERRKGKCYSSVHLLSSIIFMVVTMAISSCKGQHKESELNRNIFTSDSTAKHVDYVIGNDNTLESNNSMRTYSNGVYSIQYPKDWIVTKDLNDFTDVHIGSKTANIGFTIIHFSSEQSLEDVQKASDGNMVEAGFDIVENRELEISGLRAYETTYFIRNMEADNLSDDYNIAFISYLLKKNEIIYNIKFGNCFEDKNVKIARNIINTFIFLE